MATAPLMEKPMGLFVSNKHGEESHGTIIACNETNSSLNLFTIWLKICSYITFNWYIMFILALMTTFMVLEYALVFQTWYQHIIQPTWEISSYITFYMLHRNLDKSQTQFILENLSISTKVQFYVFAIGSILAVTLIRFLPISFSLMMEFICQSPDALDIIATIGAFIVNLITMYTLNLMISFLSLEIVEKYDKLAMRIKTEANITINEIKKEFDKIEKNIITLKKDWELVVTVSFVYHLIGVVTYGTVWIVNISNDLWLHCDNNDEWTSMMLHILRGCVRIFGLLYGILRLNHKPRKLAKVINRYCSWEDQTQQFQIQRLKECLTEFQDKFKVMGIGIEWKHFVGIILSAIATGFGALARERFE